MSTVTVLLILILVILLVGAVVRPLLFSRGHLVEIIVWVALLLLPPLRALGVDIYVFAVLISIIAALIDLPR